MRIDIRNLKREPLFAVEVDDKDPPSGVKPPASALAEPRGDLPPLPAEVYLEWDSTIDDHGHLRRCPVCGCRELFVRKDFPQVTGFAIIVLAGIISMVLVGFRLVIWAVGILAAVAVIDAAVYFFTGRCLVCYRCRSEFRNLPIRKDHAPWQLSIGEKYREVTADAEPSGTDGESTT